MSGQMRDGGHAKSLDPERLDRAAREVVRASAAGDAEAEAAAEAPFLYARVRASIERERRRREEGEGWLGLFAVALRAAPGMALVAGAALGLFLWTGAGEAGGPPGIADVLLAERDGDIERVVFADARTPSSDEVLSTIIGEESEAGR